MLRRIPIRPAVRFNYYNKYGIHRGATDDEIKKAINAHTGRTMMGMGVGVPNKKKAAMLGIFAARDQWAKFVLLKKRDAYHIWLDEGNMAKAIGYAINKNKQTIKMDQTQDEPKQKDYKGLSAEELNRQMSDQQRNSSTSYVPPKEQPKLNEGPDIIDMKEKKKGFSSEDKKAIATVIAPFVAFFSLRNPAFARVIMVPVAVVLYIVIESNRGKSKTADMHAGEESLSFRQRDRA